MSDRNNKGSTNHGKRQRSGGHRYDRSYRRSNDNEQRSGGQMHDNYYQRSNDDEQRSGGQMHDNYYPRSNDDEQRNEQERDRRPYFPDNQQSSAQPPGYDQRPQKYERNNDNSSRGNTRSLHGQSRVQGQWGQQRGPQRRPFNMKNNDRHHQGNFDPKNASKQGDNSDAGQYQAAACAMVKTESRESNLEKSLDSDSGVKGIAVPSKSGVFKCEPNLTDEDQSIKSDPDNPDDSDKRGKRQNRGPEKSWFKEIEGDLFTAPEDVSLAHCVGADLRMGSGIAVRFRNKFQSVGKLFDQRVEPGGVARISDGKRYVFYLVTKQSSSEKPTNSTMRQSLLALCDRCKILGVTKIAMPRIGCGQDGLSWNDVKQMLMEIFSNGFEITVYKLDESFLDKSAPGSKSRVGNEKGFLKDVEEGTGLLYIGCAHLWVSDEMKSIDTKYPFLKRLKPISSELGFTICTKIPRGRNQEDDVVYGLTCKESVKSPISYEHLELAIQKLKKINIRHKFEFFGIQAFKQENDAFVMDKIDTLLRNSGIDAEFSIFWPPSLRRSSIPGQSSESIKVERGPDASAQGQQPILPHASHSAVPLKDRRLKEVESKMNSHSLADKNEPEPSDSMETDWENPLPLPEVHETLRGDPEDDEEWSNIANPEYEPDKDPQAYANAERRRSKEKKEANEMRKQKEKQDRRSGGQRRSCVTEYKGDLFDAEKTMCLAHCVGADFRMGAGIAVIFRQQFGSVGELLDQRVDQGGVAYIQTENRYIFYLVTKRKSDGKPTYETMHRSLIALHEKCLELNVRELAMPRIGCGLDRLEWNRVKNMLDDIFSDGFAIKIYNLEKQMYNSPAVGRSSSFGTDTSQQNAMIRDMQRTSESTHRRMLIRNDKIEELTGPNGYEASTKKIEDRLDEIVKNFQEFLHQFSSKIESKIDDLTKVAQANSETFESLQHRVTDLETINVNLIERLEVVESHLYRPLATNAPMHPFPQLEGPPPLLSRRGLQYFQNNLMHAGVYPAGYNSSFVPSGYGNPSIPGRVYGSEHLPGERDALLRRVKDSAANLGYKSYDADGKIFVFTQKDGSDVVQINNHEDLTRFCQHIGK